MGCKLELTECIKANIMKNNYFSRQFQVVPKILDQTQTFSFNGKEVVALVIGEGGGTELVQDAYSTFWFPCRADSSTVKY